MKIYYAHCMAIYGTHQERRDIELLGHLGFTVISPATDAITRECADIELECAGTDRDAGTEKMARIFKPLVQGCDALVFRALPSGTVPAGVYREVCWAQEVGLPILELPGFAERRVLTVAGTKAYLAEVGER